MKCKFQLYLCLSVVVCILFSLAPIGSKLYAQVTLPGTSSNNNFVDQVASDGGIDFISEQNYQKDTDDVVIPFLTQYEQEGYYGGVSEQKIHYAKYILPNSTSSVVILHGYTESLYKFNEINYYFLKKGYNVYSIDQRGHGFSGRLGRDSTQVHVEKFDDYVQDLKIFMDEVVIKDNPQELILYGFSMGGCVAARFAEQYNGYIDMLVLTSPMLQISTNIVSPGFLQKLTSIGIAVGLGKRYCPGNGPFNEKGGFDGSVSSCSQRYYYYLDKQIKVPELRSGGISYGWANEAFKACKMVTNKDNVQKINVPVLIFEGEKDTAVSPNGNNEFAKWAKDCRIIKIKEAKHQIYFERDDILQNYLNEMFSNISKKH